MTYNTANALRGALDNLIFLEKQWKEQSPHMGYVMEPKYNDQDTPAEDREWEITITANSTQQACALAMILSDILSEIIEIEQNKLIIW